MPLEFETFNCGLCGKPIETEWCSDGLLPGPYALLGEVFFCAPDCVNKYGEKWNEDREQGNLDKSSAVPYSGT